jgi:hypothetical protein
MAREAIEFTVIEAMKILLESRYSAQPGRTFMSPQLELKPDGLKTAEGSKIIISWPANAGDDPQ